MDSQVERRPRAGWGRDDHAARATPTSPGPALTCNLCGLRRQSPVSFQLAADVVERDASDDRAAVGTDVWRIGDRQLRDQALHLFARQGRVGLHGGAAGDEREGAVEGRDGGAGACELVDRGLDEAAGLARLQKGGDGADDDGGTAEALEGEAQALERLAPALEQRARRRRQLERLREEERLGRRRPIQHLAPDALEQDPLVGHVLVEEEDLLADSRDAGSVLNLTGRAYDERAR